MDYNLFTAVKTSKDITKMIHAELNSIQQLTESIIFQVRQQNNENVRTTPLLMKNEGTQDGPTSKLINNLGLNEHLHKVVQSFLISLIEYINSANKHNMQSNHSRIINSPAFFSISTVCSILWKRIQEIPISGKNLDNVKQHVFHCFEGTEEEGGVMHFSKATQTANSCLTYCESCYLSTKLIKSLVKIILIEQSKYDVKDSLVASYRETIGANVFDLSQWGAMSGWINAVEGDLKRAAAFLSQTAKELAKVKVNKEVERKKHDSSMNSLKDTLQMVKSQLEAEQAQNGYLTLQIENLNKALERRMLNIDDLKKCLTEQRNKFEKVIQSMDGIKHKITQLKQSQEYIRLFVRSNFTIELSKLSELKKSAQISIQFIQNSANAKYNNEQRNLLEMQIIMRKKDEEINQLLSRCNAANKENTTLKEKHEVQNIAISNQKEEFTIKSNELQGIISKLERKINEEKRIKDQSNEIHQNTNFDYDADISGNPIKDMERQRLLNKQKIRTLIRENSSLKITIQKLKGAGSVKSNESSLNG